MHWQINMTNSYYLAVLSNRKFATKRGGGLNITHLYVHCTFFMTANLTAEPLVSGPDDVQLRRRLRHLRRFLQVDVRIVVRPAQVAASSPTMAAGGSTAAAAASQRAGLRGVFPIGNNQHHN